MAELLTTEEIRGFYNNLLLKPGYVKLLKKSLTAVKIEQILSYAKRVNNEASHQLKYKYKENSKASQYVKEILNFEFPAFASEQTKNLDYTDFDYEYKLKYWEGTSALIINEMEEQKSVKKLPPLPDCFNDKKYFLNLLKDPRISECYIILEDGSYNWTSTKVKLAALAERLKIIGKLKDIIRTNQDLAKIFCLFFNVEFNEKTEKQFQSNRIGFHDFDFIN